MRKLIFLVVFGMILLLLSQSMPVNAIATPWLHVDGRYIKDPEGNIVILRGISLVDLGCVDHDYGSYRQKSVTELIDMATDESNGWYARVIRLPVYPVGNQGGPWNEPGWLANPDDYFNNHLNPAVQRCIEKGIYCIVDWHYIADYQQNDATTRAFWSYIAPKYKDIPNVIFELYNEPMNPDNWATWKATAQPWVDLIRSYAPNNLILVSGPRWAQNLDGARTDPFTGGNIVYVAHIYPEHHQSSWDSWFGNAANVHPFFITEWGYHYGAPSPCSGTQSSYGDPFKAYIEAKGNISWTAWCFDNDWEPMMFTNRDPNWVLLSGNEHMGQFVKDWLYERRNDNLPLGGAPPSPSPSSSFSPTPTATATPTSTPTPLPSPSPGQNLALNKTATASSLEDSSYQANNAVDGNLSSRWSSAFSDPQWIYVDLGAAVTFNRVILRWEAAYGSSFKIQVSDDATSWTDVYSLTGGLGGTNDITFPARTARYVRMYGTARGTPYGYSLYEIEVCNYTGVNVTPTTSVSPTPTVTPTPSPTATATITPTNTPTPTVATPTNTPTPSIATPTNTPTPTVPTPTNTPTPSPTASVVPTPTPTSTGGYVVSYDMNDWGGGATVNIFITNNTSVEVRGWTMEWTFPGNQVITSSWKVSSCTQEGASVSVVDAGYNGVIPPNGGTSDFGFNLSYSGINEKPVSFTLNGVPCEIAP